MSDTLHIDAHAAGAAGDGAHGGREIRGGEVRGLGFGDLLDLGARNLANLGGIGGATALFNTDRLADQYRGGRGLHDEREASIRVARDHGGYRTSLLPLRGLRIELLAELHDVDALLAQRRSNRGRRIGRARRHLQLDIRLYFLCHVSLALWVQTP